jgi:hypothetical protein
VASPGRLWLPLPDHLPFPGQYNLKFVPSKNPFIKLLLEDYTLPHSLSRVNVVHVLMDCTLNHIVSMAIGQYWPEDVDFLKT